MSDAPAQGAVEVVRGLLDVVQGWLVETLEDHAYLLVPVLYSIVRATGVTVQSGTTGLLFSFGRAKKLVPPGFRMLIPFLQVVRIVPTRQRTMDLPSQRVTTFDGLVYFADANLVYRVVDVQKALIEVDDLLNGMRQMLVLAVAEVLRGAQRTSFQRSADLDDALSVAMARRVEPWGIEVERAGFTSITPSPKTLRLTQLSRRVGARRAGFEALSTGVPRSLALPLLGTSQRVLARSRWGREQEVVRRRARRVARLFRRTESKLAELELDLRARKRLRRELLADAGLGGVLGDAGFGDDAPPREAAAGAEGAKDERRRRASASSARVHANPTRVRRSPTGRNRSTPGG